MKYILNAIEMQNADKYTIEKLNITSIELIEKVAKSVAEIVKNSFEEAKILVVTGAGNNGADGYAAAVCLRLDSQNVNIYECSDKINKECNFFKEKYTGLYITDTNKFKNYDVIIDAIFGTGLNRDISDNYYKIIEEINKQTAYKISIDLPSGINSDNGKVLKIAVKANQTIAIQNLKLGHLLNDGIDYCGKIVIKDIGIILPETTYAAILENKDLEICFPKRNKNVNKGNYGRCSIIGGSYEYSGAPLLAASAICAFKMGVGYVNLCVPMSLINCISPISIECTKTLLKDKNGELVFDKLMLKKVLDISKVVCIGMGTKVSEEIYKSIEYILKNFNGKLVIDADGLNVLSAYGLDILKTKKCQVVLTPHIKEFSRLAKISIEKIEKNAMQIVKDFSKEYNVIVALKSATTIVTDGDNTYINANGNSALSKGGSGDVLSGIIGGLLAREISPIKAVICGSYILGKTAELLVSENENEYSILPTDIVANINRVINKICENIF